MYEKIKSVFEKRVDNFRLIKEKQARKINILTAGRLSSFIAGLVLTILIFKISVLIAILVFLVFLVFFGFFVKKSVEIKRLFQKTSFLEKINKDEISRMNYDLSKFDTGDEFIDQNHYYSYDLDIFGDFSLFQYLNQTVSWSGKQTLAHWLTTTFSKDEILQRQEAVRELRDQIDFRQSFHAEGMFVKDCEEDYKRIQEWLRAKPILSRKKIVVWSVDVLPVITVLLWLAVPFNISYMPAVVFSLLQLFITGIFLKPINHLHSTTSGSLKMIRQLDGLLKIIYSGKYSSDKLKEISSLLGRDEHGALTKTGKLAQMINLLDNRLNMPASLFLNAVLMWDLRISLKLEKWKNENKEQWPVWLYVLGTFDALLSLSAFAYKNPGFVFPELRENLPFKCCDAGHVLIPRENRVCNDLEIDKEGKVILITGSNMSGKSTFLRAIGINMALTYAGAPVCAGQFSTPVIQLFTSMRISDDLSRQESTFYAELKRLRLMLELEEEMKLFILLDEILKGTNSQDKYTGSKALIKQLLSSQAISIVATHDLALSELEKNYPGKLSNYSFEVEISKGRFNFDYKLNKGVCSIMNASELMKQMGIKL